MIDEIIQSSINDAVNLSSTYWDGSIFEPITALGTDQRGRWGEDLLHRLLTDAGVPNTWLQDSNTNMDDGTYDIQLNDTKARIEVKTSLNPAYWQHENIYAAPVWDYLAFIDVLFDQIVFTIVSHDDMAPYLIERTKHPVFNKTGVLRGSQTDKYKMDFGPKQHTLGVATGLSFRYTVGDDPSQCTAWIKNLLTNPLP